MWAHEGPPQRALRALLDLTHPQHPDAPARVHPAPPSLCVPRVEQRPMTIRLPPLGRAGRRVARLAAAMATMRWRSDHGYCRVRQEGVNTPVDTGSVGDSVSAAREVVGGEWLI